MSESEVGHVYEDPITEEEKAERESDTACSMTGCRNAGIYEYDGYVDQFSTLHFNERVASPLCAKHYHSKKKSDRLPYGEWTLMGMRQD